MKHKVCEIKLVNFKISKEKKKNFVFVTFAFSTMIILFFVSLFKFLTRRFQLDQAIISITN